MLNLQNLSKRFGTTVAVEDLTLEVREGEIFGLLGPNGAGKTTTVNMAVGLLQPDQGQIQVGTLGAPDAPQVRTQLGVAPQALAIYEELTGDENLKFFGQIQQLRGSQLDERVDWALEFVGLSERRRDRVAAYSGGMKRRLNLAIALIHDPPVLLLDEPTVGVDPQSRNAIFDNIELLHKEGKTIVYTTHYMEEAQRLCDRVGIIDQGKLLALDTVDGLLEAHGGKSVVIVEQDSGALQIETDDPISELLRLREQNNLTKFRVKYPDLEAVFLNLTGRHLRD